MRITVLVVSILSGVLSVGTPTAAQAPLEEPRVPGWVFTPALSVGGTWDDNVLLLFREETTPRDYGSALNPSLNLDFTGRRTVFTSGYDGSFVLYRTLTELNSTQQTARATFEHRATKRLTLFAQESFVAAPTTDALNLAGVPFYRIGSLSNSAGGGVEAALAKHTSLRAAYTLQTIDFEADDPGGLELRGGHTHLVEVAVTQAIAPRLSLGGEYTLQQALIAGRPNLPEFPEDRFSIHSAAATVTYQVSPTVTITGGAGYARLVASLNQAARTGPTVRAGITHRGRRAILTGGYERSFIPSYGFGGTFQNEEWSGTASIPFARNRAYVDGSIAWLHADALYAFQPTLSSLWLSSKVGYRATRWLSLEGFYNRAQQTTERAPGQLSRNQVGFQVVTTKPLKLR